MHTVTIKREDLIANKTHKPLTTESANVVCEPDMDIDLLPVVKLFSKIWCSEK